MEMESGHEDRVTLQQDGVRPRRLMGSSLLLCDSIYVCARVCVSVCVVVGVVGGGVTYSTTVLTALSLTSVSAKIHTQTRRNKPPLLASRQTSDTSC